MCRRFLASCFVMLLVPFAAFADQQVRQFEGRSRVQLQSVEKGDSGVALRGNDNVARMNAFVDTIRQEGTTTVADRNAGASSLGNVISRDLAVGGQLESLKIQQVNEWRMQQWEESQASKSGQRFSKGQLRLQGSDCCIDNGTPGCDDPTCEGIVCAIDSFCCDTAWDGVCADLANDECEVCGAAPPVVPANDECENAEAIAGIPALVSGTTTDATFDDVGFCGTTNTAPGVWYSLSLGANTGVIASTCQNGGSGFDTKIGVFCGDCENTLQDGSIAGPFCVGGNDDDGACGFDFTSSVTWCAEAGREYLILVHGFGTATGDFTMSVEDDGTDCSAGPFALCAECIVDCEDTEGEPNCGVSDANSDGTVDTADDTTNGGCNVNLADVSNCCIANGGIGCDDPDCEAAVCAADSFCCTFAWDGICANAAINTHCVELCDVEPVFAFSDISCGDTLCGSGASSAVIRDTDWLQLILTDFNFVTTTLNAEFGSASGPINTGGTGNCADATAIAPVIVGQPCIDAVNGPNLLTPGTWWFFVGAFPFVDNGCPSEYQYTVECEPLCCPDCELAELLEPFRGGDVSHLAATDQCFGTDVPADGPHDVCCESINVIVPALPGNLEVPSTHPCFGTGEE